MASRNLLIGTFINSKDLAHRVMRRAHEIFSINKAFMFEVGDSSGRYLLTFNINNSNKDESLRAFKTDYKNTIQLHRNKDNNALYTINSLNKIIENQNGSQDKAFKVNWEDYKDSCVLVGNDGKLKILKTKLSDVINL